VASRGDAGPSVEPAALVVQTNVRLGAALSPTSEKTRPATERRPRRSPWLVHRSALDIIRSTTRRLHLLLSSIAAAQEIGTSLPESASRSCAARFSAGARDRRSEAPRRLTGWRCQLRHLAGRSTFRDATSTHERRRNPDRPAPGHPQLVRRSEGARAVEVDLRWRPVPCVDPYVEQLAIDLRLPRCDTCQFCGRLRDW
jgi:hypothetical protein